MFDREEALTQWRARAAASGAMDAVGVAEQEARLLNEIESLRVGELTEEEAFVVAARRVEDVATFGAEAPASTAGAVVGHRGFWVVAGCLAYIAFAYLLRMVQMLVALPLLWLPRRYSSYEWLIAFGAIVLLVTAAHCVLVFRIVDRDWLRRWPGRIERWSDRGSLLAGAVLGVVFLAAAADLLLKWMAFYLMPAPEALARYWGVLNWSRNLSSLLLPVLLVWLLARLGRTGSVTTPRPGR